MNKGRILVTGANRGIGLEIVKQYANDNWEVVACCRSPESAYELNKLASTSGGTIQILPLDFNSLDSIQSLAKCLSNEAIDILFSNAGLYGSTQRVSLERSQDFVDEWQKVLLVNSIAPVVLVETLKANMLLGQCKLIVLTSSKMGSIEDNNSGGAYVYRSSKAALNAVGKSLAIDMAVDGFKVALIHPGWVQTDMGGPNAQITPQESVQGIRLLLNNFTQAQSGYLFNYDGSQLPW